MALEVESEEDAVFASELPQDINRTEQRAKRSVAKIVCVVFRSCFIIKKFGGYYLEKKSGRILSCK